MAAQANGAIEYGSAPLTGILTGTGQVLCPPVSPGTDNRTGLPYSAPLWLSMSDRGSLALVVSVAATQAFTLDYQFTTDAGATWYIGSQIASSTVTVDGGVAGNTQSARLDIQVGYQYRVQLYNNSGSTLAGAYEWRLYSDNA